MQFLLSNFWCSRPFCAGGLGSAGRRPQRAQSQLCGCCCGRQAAQDPALHPAHRVTHGGKKIKLCLHFDLQHCCSQRRCRSHWDRSSRGKKTQPNLTSLIDILWMKTDCKLLLLSHIYQISCIIWRDFCLFLPHVGTESHSPPVLPWAVCSPFVSKAKSAVCMTTVQVRR